MVDELNGGLLVESVVDLEYPKPSAVVSGGVLVMPLASARDRSDEFDIDLDRMTGLRLLVSLQPLLMSLVALPAGQSVEAEAPQNPPDATGADLNVVVALQTQRPCSACGSGRSWRIALLRLGAPFSAPGNAEDHVSAVPRPHVRRRWKRRAADDLRLCVVNRMLTESAVALQRLCGRPSWLGFPRFSAARSNRGQRGRRGPQPAASGGSWKFQGLIVTPAACFGAFTLGAPD